mmetsp:Transcript_58780/g.140103  ORF Transcript_58780/g.140103 Transcript_58780/m.140103 type:complete len:126 (-) Transcript_58780:277-654(-)
MKQAPDDVQLLIPVLALLLEMGRWRSNLNGSLIALFSPMALQLEVGVAAAEAVVVRLSSRAQIMAPPPAAAETSLAPRLGKASILGLLSLQHRRLPSPTPLQQRELVLHARAAATNPSVEEQRSG